MKCEYCDNEIQPSETKCPSCGAAIDVVNREQESTRCSQPTVQLEKACALPMATNAQVYNGKYCPNCGMAVSANARQCPKCGEPLTGAGNSQPRQRVVFILLGLFFGFLGIHDFYAGYIVRGIIQLICTTLLGWLIIPLIIDMVFILIEICVTTEDAQGNKLI